MQFIRQIKHIREYRYRDCKVLLVWEPGMWGWRVWKMMECAELPTHRRFAKPIAYTPVESRMLAKVERAVERAIDQKFEDMLVKDALANQSPDLRLVS